SQIMKAFARNNYNGEAINASVQTSSRDDSPAPEREQKYARKTPAKPYGDRNEAHSRSRDDKPERKYGKTRDDKPDRKYRKPQGEKPKRAYTKAPKGITTAKKAYAGPGKTPAKRKKTSSRDA
ncbi:MAG: hypothetical protein PHG32_02855, partial [Candidatus Cloacimonetes bacterium]|nr:hypothetical protein [Candidatus Cloacimonadota bacterium]